jgi:signal transduction histidine kinase
MPNPIIQANIFFVITSIAVILVTLLVVVLLAYLVLILKDFRGVSRKVREETELIAMDINDAREHIRKKGSDISSAFDLFKGMMGKKKPPQKRS